MESRPFKVLLVFPYTTQRRNHRWHPVEPLGLLSLATYARDRLSDRIPLEIRILDCLFEGPAQCTPTDIGFRVGMTDAQIEEAVRSFAPDLVGVANSYTNTTGDVLDLIHGASRLTVAGGDYFGTGSGGIPEQCRTLTRASWRVVSQ